MDHLYIPRVKYQSELIVPGPHGSFALPQTVSELKRILRSNLAAISVPHRLTSGPSQVNVSRPSSRCQSSSRCLKLQNQHPTTNKSNHQYLTSTNGIKPRPNT